MNINTVYSNYADYLIDENHSYSKRENDLEILHVEKLTDSWQYSQI